MAMANFSEAALEFLASSTAYPASVSSRSSSGTSSGCLSASVYDEWGNGSVLGVGGLAFGGAVGSGGNGTEVNCSTDDPNAANVGSLMYLLMTFFYGLVFLVGFSGNSLVIYVVLRYSKMQTVTNTYILNLALADELFLVGLPFLIATVTEQQWLFGRVMCKLYMTTTSINQFTSIIFLTVMSADRYIAVCHPISSPKFRTPFISKIVCLTAWTVSALLMVPIFMYADTLDGGSCNIIWPETNNMNGQSAFTLYSFILGFALPLLLILCFYTAVVRRLKTVGPRHKSKEKKKSHRKVTKLVLTVVTVYIAFWLPYWASQMALIFTPPKEEQNKVVVMIFLAAGSLAYSNSAVNPVLYAFLSENFKKSFIKACICAEGREVNAQLHLENSVFPRGKKGSEKGRGGGVGGGGSGGGSGTGRHGGGRGRGRDAESEAGDAEHSTAITMTTSRSTTNNTMSAPSFHNGERDPMLVTTTAASIKTNCRNGYGGGHHNHAASSPVLNHYQNKLSPPLQQRQQHLVVAAGNLAAVTNSQQSSHLLHHHGAASDNQQAPTQV